MDLHPIFKLRTEPTEEIIQLLESVTLGTNGAKYKHLDTRRRILECDHPLFLSMERHNKPIANITFLQRGESWYVRYFAFDKFLQSEGKRKTKGGGILKENVERFFLNAMNGGYGRKVDYFYAYVDPNNTKSLWITEQFDFKPVSEIATQTFSRANPKKKLEVIKSENWDEVKKIVYDKYKDHEFFTDQHTGKPPFYIVKNKEGEIDAFCKMTLVNWEIERLPGKMGGFLTKAIPYIPVLRKIIRPKAHQFLVPEAVYIRDNDPKLLDELFESILAMEKLNLIIWWVDTKDELYSCVNTSVQWGILNKLIGVAKALVIVRKNPDAQHPLSGNPVYTTGFDFV